MDPMPRRGRTATPVRLAFLVLVGVPAWGVAADPRPADPLLRLAPPDAGATVVVEDLRSNARSFFASPLSAGLGRLSAVTAWRDSEQGRNFRRARGRIEAILGAEFADVRDGLLGEAFLLALRTPPGGRSEDARGLLLARIPDRALLDRAVAALNAAQTKSGELLRVSERKYGGETVYIREFRPGQSRIDEFYVHLAGRVFAWSNSEELIRGVLDRRERGAGGLDGRDDCRRVRGRLPAGAVVSAYLDPRFVERLLNAAPRPKDPGEGRVRALIGRGLSALRYAGAAVEWRDGFVVLHTEGVVDPSRLGTGLQRWAGRTDRPDPARLRVPPTALAVATAGLDAGAVLDVLADLVPPEARGKLDNLVTAAQGLLLGLDPRPEVLAQLGPAVTCYVEPAEPGSEGAGLPVVVDLQIGRGPAGDKAAAALDNACRTLLAYYALDDKHGGGKLRVESRTTSGAKVTALAPQTPWAYAVGDGRFVLARTAAAATRAVAARDDPAAGARFAALRAAFFPGVESFACADLKAVHAFAAPRRAAIAARQAARQNRPEAEVARDLDQALALTALFDAAFLTGVAEPGFTGFHHTLGLVAAPGPR